MFAHIPFWAQQKRAELRALKDVCVQLSVVLAAASVSACAAA